jgi:GTPase SAR1 family protein
MVRAFYNNAHGAFVIFDVADPISFEGAAEWKKDIDEKLETKIPVILVANKIDLIREEERMKLRQAIEEFSRYIFCILFIHLYQEVQIRNLVRNFCERWIRCKRRSLVPYKADS